MKFEKPATSIEKQISILKNRGMSFNDEKNARHYLTHIGYTHLRPYWEHFQETHEAFRKETEFEDVFQLYAFDRQLRLLVLDAIERFEISLRAQWVRHLSHTYNPHGYLNESIYKDRIAKEFIKELKEDISVSKDYFITHYKGKYSFPTHPPIWMAAEIISFGRLSKCIGNLRHGKDRKKIISMYNLDEMLVTSFTRHLNTIRNICAHHGCLWDKKIAPKMVIPNNVPPDFKQALNHEKNTKGEESDKKMYNALVLLSYLMDIINPESKWRKNLTDLIRSTPLVNPSIMGFPQNWQTYKIWK